MSTPFNAEWWRVDLLVDLVLIIAEPSTAFACRQVCRKWYGIVLEMDSAWWRRVYAAVSPGTSLSLGLMESQCPSYAAVRRYDMASLAVSPFIQNVIVFDIYQNPIRWIARVPKQCTVHRLMCFALQSESDVQLGTVFSSGVQLHPDLRICDHTWPTRRGRKGWVADLPLTLVGDVVGLNADVQAPVEFPG